MSDTKNEPLAAIIAEMREWSTDEDDALARYADRIDAAASRERVEIRRDAEIEWTRIGYDERKAEERHDNAAAMRAALEKLTDAVRNYFGWDDAPAVQDRDDPTAYFCAEMSAALAALAAPARNADRFATAKEALDAFMRDARNTEGLDHLVCLTEIVGRVCKWLFNPAEGGDHA